MQYLNVKPHILSSYFRDILYLRFDTQFVYKIEIKLFTKLFIIKILTH